MQALLSPPLPGDFVMVFVMLALPGLAFLAVLLLCKGIGCIEDYRETRREVERAQSAIARQRRADAQCAAARRRLLERRGGV
jgi:hypothetical protein